jgi:hypothetical protein
MLLLWLLLVVLLLIIVALQELIETGGLHTKLQQGRSGDPGRPAKTSQFTSWFITRNGSEVCSNGPVRLQASCCNALIGFPLV